MMKNFKVLLIALSLSILASQASASVAFSVKDGEIPRTKILFLGFDSTNQSLKNDSTIVLEHIKRNLKTTDLFEIIKQSGQIEASPISAQSLPGTNQNLAAQNVSIDSLPNFEKYNKAGIGAIIVAQINYGVDGNLELSLRMWDVLDQRQLFGKFYSSSRDNYHKMANLISNEIFKAISGEKSGIFTSQILYVSESGPLNKRIKRINIIDFDGENRRVLTDGSDLVLTPIFSKRPDEIFYLRYTEKRPQIFSLDLRNLRSRKIGGFRGTTFAASINPKDSNVILISAIFDGNSDIYEMNISENGAKRLTNSPAIDTTASYSPDGKLIAFSSDRDGSQQIYIMDSNGSSVRRVSFGTGSYSKPVWSPDGKLLAFTRIKNGQFFIGVMSPNGKGEKLLTNAYLVEGAKWSPNGRYLIYAKKRGAYGQDSIPRLYVIDIISGFEFELPTPANEGASDPDWA